MKTFLGFALGFLIGTMRVEIYDVVDEMVTTILARFL